jgi:septum formation protein
VIVLASGSPRRRELLACLGLQFDVRAADVDETPGNGEGPEALARRLAESKARALAQPGALVIGADTVVARRGELFGKPENPADAVRMLRELAGGEHVVITGVAVASAHRVRTAALTSQVQLRAFSDDEIAAYVASGDPLDKAGAYAVQNEQFRPVARLDGCRCNVVGFPIGVVAELLADAGHAAPVSVERACPYGLFSPTGCCSRP